jgi:hypothetical protein
MTADLRAERKGPPSMMPSTLYYTTRECELDSVEPAYGCPGPSLQAERHTRIIREAWFRLRKKKGLGNGGARDKARPTHWGKEPAEKLGHASIAEGDTLRRCVFPPKPGTIGHYYENVSRRDCDGCAARRFSATWAPHDASA